MKYIWNLLPKTDSEMVELVELGAAEHETNAEKHDTAYFLGN